MKHLSTMVVVLFMAAAIVAAPTGETQKAAAAKDSAPAKTAVQKETKADNQKAASVKESAPVKTVAQKEVKAVDKGVPKLMGGTIVSVDAAKNTITVKLKSKDYPISIVPQTELLAKDNKISFPDLKKGDYVTINYLRFRNGERKAEKINNKTFAAKLAKMESEPKQQPKQKQVQKANAQPKAQVAPAQEKVVKSNPEVKTTPIQKEKTESEEKKETKQEVK